MTRGISSLLLISCLCGTMSLTGCGESDGTPEPQGGGLEAGKPPEQKAIYLRSRHDRPPGTTFRNSTILTMANANLLMRRGEADQNGKITTIIRDLWDVVQVTPNQRTFIIEEMSLNNVSTINGQRKEERSGSTLIDVPFEVTRSDKSTPWVLSPPEKKLSHLQEGELRMLGNLWAEGSEGLFPEEPLDLGETWKADPQSVALIVSPRLKITDGEVTCRLDEITVLRGERCGSVDVDIDVTGTIEMGGGSEMQIQLALTGKIMRSLYKNFDMRTELKGTMQMEMNLPDQDTFVSIDGVAEFLQLADIQDSQPQ